MSAESKTKASPPTASGFGFYAGKPQARFFERVDGVCAKHGNQWPPGLRAEAVRYGQFCVAAGATLEQMEESLSREYGATLDAHAAEVAAKKQEQAGITQSHKGKQP